MDILSKAFAQAAKQSSVQFKKYFLMFDFICDQAFSIGLNSGEYGGCNITSIFASSNNFKICLFLCARKLSITII
jgi:hypothetical protein